MKITEHRDACRANESEYNTEPQKAAERAELARLQTVYSNTLTKRSALQAASGDCLREWLRVGQELASAEFTERSLRPREPYVPQNSMGTLTGVPR